MSEARDRARALADGGRLLKGLTQLVEKAPSCVPCEREGVGRAALVVGRTVDGQVALPMCEEHFERLGGGLGPELGVVQVETGPAAELLLPPDHEPIGWAWVIQKYRLAVLLPARVTYVASRAGRQERVREGRTEVVLPLNYRPKPSLVSHLEYALKHEGTEIAVLAALFRRVDLELIEAELAGALRQRPLGQYLRRLWYLYESMTERRLDVADLAKGKGTYVDLLEPNLYFTAPGRRSSRHRVSDNLLGNRDFCPMVRRTPLLEEFQAKRLQDEAAAIVQQFDEDAIRRAVSYLYTKETRSSFAIEGEQPSANKTERFVALLRELPKEGRLSRERLVVLQNATVDPRFANRDFRTSQNYIGESISPDRQRIHFIPPRPEDVPSLMQGLLACMQRLEGSEVDAVVQAAIAAFGFVFIHPFDDGNGRLHRLLVHYVLARAGFTPSGLIFPISAVMLHRQHEYDQCLESFSAPLMRLLEYDEKPDGEVKVFNRLDHAYRYFDATTICECLYRWVETTVREDFRAELEYVVRFREIRRELEKVVEMPDKPANLFVRLCLANNGRLSAAKRASHFAQFSDEEIAAMEAVVAKSFEPTGGKVAEAALDEPEQAD